MSSFEWPSTASSGVPTYSTLSAFPPASSLTGTLAIALDTGIVYESFGSAWVAIGGPGTVLSIGTIDTEASPSANGATITSNALIMQSASGTAPGLVNNSAQTFSGAKTFSTAPILSSLTVSLPLQLDGSNNIISAAINLSGSQATGVLAAARFPALTGDVTTTAGALATSLVATTNSTLATLSGLTTATSLVSIGTITTGTWQGTVIGTAYGGTGKSSSYTQYGVVYASTSTLLTNTAAGAAGTVLVGGATTPSFSATPSLTTLTLTGQLLSSDGSVSAPGMAFASETGTGLYRAGTTHVGIAMGGVEALDMYKINSTQTNFGYNVAASTSITNVFSATGAYNGSLLYQYGNTSTGTSSATLFQILNGTPNTLVSLNLENHAYATSGYLAGACVITAGSECAALFLIANEFPTAPNISFAVGGRASANVAMILTTSALTMQAGAGLALNGSSSGTISILPQTAAGTYNFNLPTTAGTSGYVLTSAGGSSSPMTWSSVLTNPMTTGGDIIYGGSSGTPTRLANGSANQILTSSGSTSAPTWAAAPGATYWSGYYAASGSNYWTNTNTASVGDFTVVGTIPSLSPYQNNGFTVAHATSNLPGISFTAPRTGVLRISFVGAILPGANAAGTSYEVNLLESTTSTNIAGMAGYIVANATTQLVMSIPLEGYFSTTSGTAYNFKLQAIIASGTMALAQLTAGGVGLAIIMEYIT